MPMTLIPDCPRGRGQHGEQINTALLDAAIASILDLYLAVDNKRDDRTTLKGWLQEKMNQAEPVTYEELGSVFDRIHDALAGIHAELVAARSQTKTHGQTGL